MALLAATTLLYGELFRPYIQLVGIVYLKISLKQIPGSFSWALELEERDNSKGESYFNSYFSGCLRSSYVTLYFILQVDIIQKFASYSSTTNNVINDFETMSPLKIYTFFCND